VGGQVCSVSQTCVCNGSSCPSGCCTALSNGQCQSGGGDTACGTGGVGCQNCTSHICDPGPPIVRDRCLSTKVCANCP
jgi:hypothetical protein